MWNKGNYMLENGGDGRNRTSLRPKQSLQLKRTIREAGLLRLRHHDVFFIGGSVVVIQLLLIQSLYHQESPGETCFNIYN